MGSPHAGQSAHTFTTEVVRHGAVRWALPDSSASHARSVPSCAGCSHNSCLNTSSKVLSCGFVIPGLPFISRGGGGQIAIGSICSGVVQGLAAAPGSAGEFGAGERGRRLLQ